MELLNPSIGIVFWTTIAFLILLFLLRKFAWKPILNTVNQREQKISESLAAAEKAREEMEKLTATNEKLVQEAREERTKILAEAKQIKDKMINEAKDQAKVEADKIAEANRKEIENQKNAAIAELKDTAANLSLEIAEKVIRRELKEDKAQQAYVQELLTDIKNN